MRMRLVDEVIQEQEKRLKWLDSADAKLWHGVYAYTAKRLTGMGVQQNSLSPYGVKASRSLTSMIVHSLSGGLSHIQPRDVIVVKSLIGDIVNRKNLEKRRASNDVKAKTIELTKAGEDALKAWKRKTKSSYSLIIESLLLDSSDLYEDMEVRYKKQTEVVSDLRETVKSLNTRIKELQVQLENTGAEKIRLARENALVQSKLEYFESSNSSHSSKDITDTQEEQEEELAVSEEEEPEVKLPVEGVDSLEDDSFEDGGGTDVVTSSDDEDAPDAIGPRTARLKDDPGSHNRLTRQKGLGKGHNKRNQKGKGQRRRKKR